MATQRAPSPRFRRSDNPPNLQLTDDDDQILLHTYRHRITSSDLICRLFQHRSRQKILRRLQALWQAEYLDRPLNQMERIHARNGSSPLKYAIGRHGAHRVRERFGIETDASRWRQKNHELRARNIQHALSTTRFLVDTELSTRAREHKAFLHTDEVLQRYAAKRIPQPGARLAMRAKVDWHGYRGEEATAPDWLYALEDTAKQEIKIFMLEIDEGTETVEPGEKLVRSRSFFHSSSLLRKFVVYASAFKTRSHQHQYGLPAFHVLTVTTHPDRMKLMQATYEKHLSRPPHGVDPRLFLFTDWETWQSQEGSERIAYNAVGRPLVLV